MNGNRFGVLTVLVLGCTIYFLNPNLAAAYPVGGTPAPITTSSFDTGGSFQNLVAPFSNFFESLQNSIGTSSVVGGQMPNYTEPKMTFGGLQQIDQWFFGLTNVRVSTFFITIASSTLWVLGLVQQILQWILGVVRR